MGKRFDHIPDEQIAFIQKQKMFVVGTAAADGTVNVSPKGCDSFRVLDKNRVAWLNLTGSGNETATHVVEHPRMTIMFSAFEGPPNILRLYGTATVMHPRDDSWEQFASLFPAWTGARQIFEMKVELVQTSCGFAVPYYDYAGERETLTKWADKKGKEGIEGYWDDRNRVSLDGKPTGILPE